MFGDSVTPVSLTLTLSRREREPFGSVCYPGKHFVSTRYVTRLTGPTRGFVTPRPGKRSAARQQAFSTLPVSMPGGGCALPGLHSPCALL
ncbi:hypothetical protein NUBL21977_16920 [Klebsiella quasipneumoniae]|nr:hypothetical protein NUBL21977_16920 [Klebsiella quasipneumoniae]